MRLPARFRRAIWERYGLFAMMLGSMGLLMVGLFSWQNPMLSQVNLSEGDIAPFDIVAVYSFSYESSVLNERARQRAADAIPDQYDFRAESVRHQQVDQLRQQLQTLSSIRNDTQLSAEEKLQRLFASLSTSPTIPLNEEVPTLLLSLSDEEWNWVRTESPKALDRILREEIREVTVDNFRQRIPYLLSGELNERASMVAIPLIQALMVPNSFYNEARTVAMRDLARNAIPPQIRVYEQGETIIRAGDRATADGVEAIQKLNSNQRTWDQWTLLRSFCFAGTLLFIAATGIHRLRPELAHYYPQLALLLLTSTLWLLAARFMTIPHPWLPYLYPLSALGLLLSALLDVRVALLFLLLMALVSHVWTGNNPSLIVYWLFGALAGLFALQRAERISSFFLAGLAAAGAHFVAFFILRITPDGFIASRLLQGATLALTNGVLSAGIAFLGCYLLGNLFSIVTSLQLNELSRPTHPLLRQLQMTAPGTYFHTILVSNMAERAAAAIGADALLTRVGAYYHDIGKTVRPYFFTENIVDGSSPHNRLDPATSAQIIISHVTDGLDLAYKHHLPPRIQDFIREHHGRSLVRYFYVQAQNALTNASKEEGKPVETIDEAAYRYPGPNPQSKETAILMLADSCEAIVRARRPSTQEELQKLVEQLMAERLASGDLNQSPLTLHDLKVISETFLQVLQGVHHPRINYPELQKAQPSPPPPTAGNQNGATAPASTANGSEPIPPPTAAPLPTFRTPPPVEEMA